MAVKEHAVNSRKCATDHCRGRVFKYKKRGFNSRFCHKCRMRKWRDEKPMQSAYASLRTRARQRGIEFTISFYEFVEFAVETKYLTETGNFAESLTVDRINNLLGYVPGNIRALTRSENSIKRCRQDEMRMRAGFAWKNK